jgi:hypothetical protein
MDRLQNYIKDIRNTRFRGGAVTAQETALSTASAGDLLLYFLFLTIVTNANVTLYDKYNEMFAYLILKPVLTPILGDLIRNPGYRVASRVAGKAAKLTAIKAWIVAQKTTGGNLEIDVTIQAYTKAAPTLAQTFNLGQKVTVNGKEGTIESIPTAGAAMTELDNLKTDPVKLAEYIRTLGLLIDDIFKAETLVYRTNLKQILDPDLIRLAPSIALSTALRGYGIPIAPFYKVTLASGGSLYPVYGMMLTPSSGTSSTNAYVDYGEGDIPILEASIHKIEKNNTKKYLATKSVGRQTTIKALLDQVRDANPSTRCLVSSGGMFVTSLDPSAYYTSFHSLGIKHRTLELELI